MINVWQLIVISYRLIPDGPEADHLIIRRVIVSLGGGLNLFTIVPSSLSLSSVGLCCLAHLILIRCGQLLSVRFSARIHMILLLLVEAEIWSVHLQTRRPYFLSISIASSAETVLSCRISVTHSKSCGQ